MSDPLPDPMESYLARVADQLGDRSERERHELLEALRRHIHDALRARGGSPGPADIQAVLAAMDAPEDFAPGGGAGPTPSAGPPPRRGADRWFLLGLCFLGLNAWLAWRLTHPAVPGGVAVTVAGAQFAAGEKGAPRGQQALRWHFDRPLAGPGEVGKAATNIDVRLTPGVAGGAFWTDAYDLEFRPVFPWPAAMAYSAELLSALPVPTGRVFGFETAPLRLEEVVQVGLSPEREVDLRRVFNATPDHRALAKHLQLADGAGSNLAYSGGSSTLSNSVLIRTAPLLQGDRLAVKLTAGFQPAVGTVGTREEARFDVALKDALELQGVRPEAPSFGESTLECVFTEAIDADSAPTFIAVAPEVAFTVEPFESWRGNGCKLRGAFDPGRVYALTFKAGLKSVNGRALPRALTRQVQFPNRPSSVAFAAPGNYLSPRGSLLVPLSVVNVPSVTFRAAPLLAGNLVQYVMREDSRYPSYYGSDVAAHSHYLTAGERAVTTAVSAAMNREVRIPADLRALVGEAPLGPYVITASSDATGDDETALVVVTDIGLSARRAKNGWLVWANSLREAAPMPDVDIVLHAVNGSELARGRTGPDGTVFLGLNETEEPEQQPILLLASRKGDCSYLKLSDTVLPGGEGGVSPYLEGTYEASVFTDRGIYRPGETLHVRALVRDRALACPAPFPVVFRILRPDGRAFREAPAQLNAYGAAEWGGPLPDFLPTGRYRIELCLPGTLTTLGSTDVALEEFVPPQIRLAIDAPTGRVDAAGSLAVGVQAEHLFGRPAAGLQASALVTIEAAAFAPSNWIGYAFGDGEKTFSRIELNLGRTNLDAEGRAAFEGDLSDGWAPPAALRAVAGITVFESSGRPVTRYASTSLDPYPFYIGLRRPSDGGAWPVGATQQVMVAAVQPDGHAVSRPQPLKAEFFSVTYSTVLKRGPDGRYAYESSRSLTKVREQLVTVGATPAPVEIAPPSAGDYVLVVSEPESGASSTLALTASSPDQSWVTWSRERPDRIEIEANREVYQPGDRARVTVKSPFGGSALLTVESDRIHEQRVFALTGTTTVLEVPIREDYAPNVYCQLSLVRPAVAESVWSAHRACGAALLRVQPAGRRIVATIEAPAAMRPQSDLDAVIHLADESGHAVSGEVTVAAVDEGICMLTEFATPDPLRDFLRPRLPGVTGFDLYSLLMPVTEASAFGASAPGGDGSGSLRRRLNPISALRFHPVALWQSNLMADSNGVAHVRLAVPEFTGELRLMAVAWNRGQMGSAQSSVQVKRPLVVQPSLPRFLAPGDRCALRVPVFNEMSSAVTGTLRVTTGGPLHVAQPERSLKLPAGGSVMESLSLESDAAVGRGLVTVEVAAGGESYRETIELAVRPASPPAIEVHAGRLAPGESLALKGPTNWIAGTVAQTVRASGRPEARLGRALDYLLRYPYGCLEQTVSSTMPLLRLPDLAGGAIGKEETSRLVQAGIVRVLSMQGERGFTLWPNSAYVHEWSAVYAVHFLVECRRAGFEVPQDRLALALHWLHDRLGADVSADAESGGWKDDMGLRAYACMVLARAGEADAGWMARLREESGRLGAGARAMLAAALLQSGQPALGREVLAGAAVPDLAAQVEAGGNLASGSRDAALLLLAWLDVDPESAEAVALADALLRAQRDGHWGTTHDDAWVLLALGTYAARQPVAGPEVHGRLATEAGDLSFDARGLVVTNQPGALTLSNSGPGMVYYVVQAEGVPATGAVEEGDHGLSVSRVYLDPSGDPLPAGGMRQGDLVVVKLTVDTMGDDADNVVIEDLLPAGLEIENPSLATARTLPWISEKTDWCIHRELRDDRFLLFSGGLSGRRSFYYAARAVTPGTFALPPVSASAMYAPARRSASGAGALEVHP